MSETLTEIDGSLLEGGGQILRIAVCLSALTQKPVKITNIRAGRSKPGLMEQHLKGILLVRDICSAMVKGAEIGSTSVEFWPGKISAGNYTASVSTAGSTSLLLQISLPCVLLANGESTLTLRGGTNAEMAPPIDYTTEVFRPILEKFGGTFDFDLIKRGYFPKGGGEVIINVKPVEQLKGCDLTERGQIVDILGYSFVSGSLPFHLAQNMTKGATSVLSKVQRVNIETYKENRDIAPDNCFGILVVALTDKNIALGASALGNRNEVPYQTGVRVGEEMLKYIEDGSSVDEHNQDQIIILMAIAEGMSRIRITNITMHTKTAIYVVELLTDVKFDIQEYEGYSIIECKGLGLKTYL